MLKDEDLSPLERGLGRPIRTLRVVDRTAVLPSKGRRTSPWVVLWRLFLIASVIFWGLMFFKFTQELSQWAY